MELQKGYEVVRFTEQGSLTRIKMDYMKGTLLLYLLQKNSRIEKKILYQWVESLVTQLCLFHTSQKNQCYRYLSPESILVTEEDELYLLDLEAESNAFVMRNMQRREMRGHFMKQEMYRNQNQKWETDLYSLGKTLQFLLSQVRLDSPLTKKEERQFYRFIQKCLGNHSRKTYQNFIQIQKEIPKYKKNTRDVVHKGVISFVLILTTCLILVETRTKVIQNFMTDSQVPKESQISGEAEDHITDETETADATDATETTDLTKTTDKNQGNLEVEQEDLLPRLQAYLQNNTTEDNYRIMEEGAEAELELVGYIATVYDREEKFEEAIYYYQILTHLETNPNQLEIVYLRITELEEQLEKYDEARKTYQDAMKVSPKNEKIGIRYLTFICKYDAEDIEKQNQELSELMTEFGELEETDEFKKLAQEYGIKAEEGKVWIEKEKVETEQ